MKTKLQASGSPKTNCRRRSQNQKANRRKRTGGNDVIEIWKTTDVTGTEIEIVNARQQMGTAVTETR